MPLGVAPMETFTRKFWAQMGDEKLGPFHTLEEAESEGLLLWRHKLRKSASKRFMTYSLHGTPTTVALTGHTLISVGTDGRKLRRLWR